MVRWEHGSVTSNYDKPTNRQTDTDGHEGSEGRIHVQQEPRACKLD